MQIVILLFLFFSLSSCKKENTAPIPESICNKASLNPGSNYIALLDGYDEEFMLQTVEKPDDSGALGRNKNGYFHVRFQLNMSKLTDIAIRFKRIDALESFIKNLDYSFSFQEENGGFQLQLPSDLINRQDIPLVSPGDRVSGVAFFAYSLGVSLLTLESSDWYLNDPQIVEIREHIRVLTPKITATLTYLKANKEILQQVDQNAPNRLLFDAGAFYFLGTYVKDTEAKELGIDFIKTALDLTDTNRGYFIEGGGWDSSYNGVALQLGMELFSIIPNSHSIKKDLEQKLICAADWQLSRILTTGEISTEGNTRVFPGGESFIGNEKMVDVLKTVSAFTYLAVLSENDEYKELANLILDFYL